MNKLAPIWMEEADRERPVCTVCHASTLLPMPDGALLVAWFAGSAEGAADVGIYISRRSSSGTWSEVVRVDAEPGEAHWNPVLAARRDESLILFYKVGDRIAKWRTMVTSSYDAGEHWSCPNELVPGDSGGRGPVRTKVIKLRDGTWLAGASLEKGPQWIAFIDRSEDEGLTWSASAPLAINIESRAASANGGSGSNPDIAVSEQSFKGRGIIQPSLWESADGFVHAIFRSTEGRAYHADSFDAGRTWTKPEPTTVPNNNSGLDIVCLGKGTLFLAHNPVGSNWGARTPLVLSSSTDDGKNWVQTLVLEDGLGEFSYPAIIQKDGEIFVSWTRNRKAIAVARLSSCF
jgi:predicted neuraminidase